MNISSVIPYDTYHIILYHTIPCHTIPYPTIPYHRIPYHIQPHHTTPYSNIPYLTILYHTTQCPIIPYHVMPYNTTYHTIPYYATPYHIPYHTILVCQISPLFISRHHRLQFTSTTIQDWGHQSYRRCQKSNFVRINNSFPSKEGQKYCMVLQSAFPKI